MVPDRAVRPASVAPFGRWPSPLDAATAGAGRRSRSALSSDGRRLYWLEGRPEEAGRTVVVRTSLDGRPEDVTPSGVSVRSRVHEYGGGAYCLVGPGPTPDVGYVDQTDQRVWLQRPGRAGAPEALSAEPPAGGRRYHGDLRATADGRYVLAVREAHDAAGVIERSLVALSTRRPGAEWTLRTATGFVAAPRPSPDGRRMAWITWDHPDMSWDASELWVGELGEEHDGGLSLGEARRVAGGRDGGSAADGESVGQPLWVEGGGLTFASDASGWWQPWRWDPSGTLERLCGEAGDFHGPDWVLGQATMVEVDGGLACRRRRDGLDAVGVIPAGSGTFEPIDQPCVSVGALCRHGEGVAWLGASARAAAAPWWWSPSDPSPRTLTDEGGALLAAGDVSVAQPFSVPTATHRVPGLYFPPSLGATRGPSGQPPPLLVFCHGGPTGSAEAGFDPVVQYFTSHGFAVAAVDYAGSSGYGRAYRRRLLGRWGLADPDDCVEAARGLAALGLADPERMAIRGGSAGGLTALCALARSSAFAAAVSWYGVTDLLALAQSTHDFEAHYTDGLVGPLPEAVEVYRRRSPVHLVDQMEGAVLVLQGLDDPVVPPAQAASMVAALRRRGRRVDYLDFAGEAHGFRRAETLTAALAAELAFYQDVLCR